MKIGSNKICIREVLTNEKMMFNKESSRVIFEMENVVLIVLKKSPVQCSSYFHYVFAGTLLCKCGK